MVDGGGLENRCTRKGTGGSNPSPSANLRRALAALAASVGMLLIHLRIPAVTSPRKRGMTTSHKKLLTALGDRRSNSREPLSPEQRAGDSLGDAVARTIEEAHQKGQRTVSIVDPIEDTTIRMPLPHALREGSAILVETTGRSVAVLQPHLVQTCTSSASLKKCPAKKCPREPREATAKQHCQDRSRVKVTKSQCHSLTTSRVPVRMAFLRSCFTREILDAD